MQPECLKLGRMGRLEMEINLWLFIVPRRTILYQFCVTFEIEEHYASKTEEQPAVEIGAGLEFNQLQRKENHRISLWTAMDLAV